MQAVVIGRFVMLLETIPGKQYDSQKIENIIDLAMIRFMARIS